MNALTLLRQHHRQLEGMFERLKRSDGDAADAALLARLATVLASHMAIEQNLFYPAVRDASPLLVDGSYEEHSVAELELKRLLQTPVVAPSFEAKLFTLADLISTHIEQEEEELFPALKRYFDEETLETLGEQLERAFEAANNEGFRALVPEGFAHTSADEARRRAAEAAQ